MIPTVPIFPTTVTHSCFLVKYISDLRLDDVDRVRHSPWKLLFINFKNEFPLVLLTHGFITIKGLFVMLTIVLNEVFIHFVVV